MVEHQPSKLVVWVRFPSPAPLKAILKVMLLKVHPSGGGKGEPVLYMRVLEVVSSQFESDYPQLSQSNSKK